MGRSCLASILSRYKTHFQKSEPFHWQEMEAAGDGQLPQLRFPARPLSQPCSLHVLQTHTSRMHCLDAQPAPTGDLHPCGPHRSPEAAGTAAKLQSCSSRRPSAPVTLLSSRELVFNNRVCFRSSITSFSNASRADGWDSPTALPLPMLTPSPHHRGLLWSPALSLLQGCR